MLDLMNRGKKAAIIQACCIVLSAGLLFAYLNFGWFATRDNLLATIGIAFGYTFPLIFIEGLYGLRSALCSYTLILIPTIILSPGEAFLLTFHLAMIHVVGFCVDHGFLKSIGKTLLSGVISGMILNAVFFFVNHLVAEGDFSDAFSNVDYIGMADIGVQILVAYLILYLEYRYLPEKATRNFPVGNFRNHVLNEQYQEQLKRAPKHPLGRKMIRILVLEALVLGFFAALVANALIPDLGEVVEVRGGVASGGAVSGMGAGLYKPARKPDAESTTVPQTTPPPNLGKDMSEEKRQRRSDRIRKEADWYMSRTRLGAFGSEDADQTNFFVLNEEGIAFDLKLILFLLDIIMPIVALIHYLLERRIIRPIAGMAMAMTEFATDSLEEREVAAGHILSHTVNTKDEVQQLHESLAYTVEEVIDYIRRLQEEQQLREDLRVAKKASEAKSNFLSNVSHEIRTPINAVLGMDEMILRESSDPRIRKYAMDIKNSGRTLVSLINDLLDFSRIEAGKLEILPVEYEMSSTLNDLVNMISVKAEEKNLTFTVDVDESIPHLLIGDEIRVKQCVINILNNAVKYTEAGSVTMTVGFEKEDEKHILLHVRVKDTGIGMKEEDMKRLFTPFERIEENRNRSIEGAGLGMSIVKQLLDMMGSQLEVESEYGEGSTFFFTLRQEVISWEPMGDFAEMYQRSLDSMKEYQSAFQAPEAKILVVDDTKMNLTVIRGLLEPTLVQVKTAMSGREAIELVKQEHYDLIFLDQRMPGLDGIETLQEMRALPSPGIEGVPVVVLTANAISGARERFIKAGFDDYLTKPIDSMKLESTIASLLPQDKVIRPGEDGYNERGDVVNGAVGAGSDAGDESTGSDAPGSVEPQDGLLRQYARIDEVDYAAAIKNCLKESILLEAVRDFATSAKTWPDEIEGFFNAMDIKNYTVRVHALKSSTRLIGALALSSQAAHLETCGDEGNMDEIHAQTPKLLADYRLFAEKLFALLAEPAGEEDDRPEIDTVGLSEAYAGIREYVDAFDFDSADAILEMLAGYRIPAEEKERYEKIRDMVMQLDHDGLLEFFKNR